MQERRVQERFFALVRKATPQMRVMAERYSGDVFFNFDSTRRSVWAMALFGKGAPLALSAVVHKYGDVLAGRLESLSSFETARTNRASSGRAES